MLQFHQPAGCVEIGSRFDFHGHIRKEGVAGDGEKLQMLPGVVRRSFLSAVSIADAAMIMNVTPIQLHAQCHAATNCSSFHIVSVLSKASMV